MKRFLYLTTALAALLALTAPAAQAGSRDGITLNGPALDGRAVRLPAGLSVDGAAEAQHFDWPPGSNGPALDGRQVATPDLAGLAINPLRLPGDSRGVLPAGQRWPAAEQDQRLQQ
jgi:hypothetical protein